MRQIGQRGEHLAGLVVVGVDGLFAQGDEAGLAALTREGLLADDEIREALLERRNAAWMPRIIRLLESDSHPLIAVGAAHMVGKDGLVALIEAQGYTVRRVR